MNIYKQKLLKFISDYDIKNKISSVNYNRYTYNSLEGFGFTLKSGVYIKVFVDYKKYYVNLFFDSHLEIPENFTLRNNFKNLLLKLSTDKQVSYQLLIFYFLYLREYKPNPITKLEIINDIPKLLNKSVQEKKLTECKKLLNSNIDLLFI
jgi:hypothetical protein